MKSEFYAWFVLILKILLFIPFGALYYLGKFIWERMKNQTCIMAHQLYWKTKPDSTWHYCERCGRTWDGCLMWGSEDVYWDESYIKK